MRKSQKVKPLFLNTDSDYTVVKPNETTFLKNWGWDTNANPNLGTGTSNPTGEGQNLLVLTPTRSNIAIPNVILPSGINKNIGSFYSDTTQEEYYFNYNYSGKHGIYVIDGNTGVWNKVIEDNQLGFTDDQDGFISEHRVGLRLVLDKKGNILEKHLLLTDSKSWQKWVNVIAGIKTNGFDASLFPYWTLQQPHFDRRELFEWPVRPPMIKAELRTIANTTGDKGKINRMVDTAIQVAYSYEYTDGRTTLFSPYSLPLIVKSEDYLSNPDNIPKNAIIKMYAGSCMVEKIRIYVRYNLLNGNSIPTITEWSDWYLYDTIYKFTNCGLNSIDVIGTDYWLRSGAWSQYNYDPIFNTIEYDFDNSKVPGIISQDDANLVQNGMPQLSVAMTDIGDSELLGNNRYGYPNLGCSITDNLDVVVKEKQSNSCNIPLRTIRLYAYIGRPGDRFSYESQVGFINGTDLQVRFGGLQMGPGNVAEIDIPETKSFDLNFADKNAFRCYLKGTPYYSDGTWYQVNSDNSLVKIDNIYDFGNADTLTGVQNIFKGGGYFICVFDFTVPADRYIATLGRHNVESSGDYRNTSTYIMGIANSRVKSSTTINFITHLKVTSLKPDSIVTHSKEMELDCTAGNIDVWGNGADTFYVYCPAITHQGNLAFRFVEGYLYESLNDPIPVELFPYQLNHGTDDSGTYTDKNGFYFAYTKVNNADISDIEFICTFNCAYPFQFTSPTNQAGSGWRPNNKVYLADHNGGVLGDCNRVLYKGTITNLDGTIPYSNIAISIKDGETVYTKSDGTFTLIIHNGLPTKRQSNVYVNAGSNFIIKISDCGQVPLTQYNENLVLCTNCTVRNYPFNLNLKVFIQGGTQTSLKEAVKYSIGAVVADLAGRLTFVNVIKELSVPSFLERNDILATFFQLLIKSSLQLTKENPDAAWFTPYVSKNLTQSRYIQWVGDSIKYIDNNGNVVSDPATAVFCSIAIDSLYNYNVARNFSTLSNYQFVQGDRLRILDDGNGHLFDVATYGDPIDIQILGTDYNQAAVAAGLLPSPTGTTTINNQQNTANQTSINIIVRYDSRLDKIIKSNGFWIEIYTPAKQSDIIPYSEISGFYPVINGEVAEFTGYSNGQPTYNYPGTIDIDYWDTYLITRNITIPKVGDRFFSHPFESPNISDTWGSDITSGGRLGVKNDNAKQAWYPADTIKSDSFVKEGLINGLGLFRSTNRKDFSSYPWGGIVLMKSQRSIIIFGCENDYFTTDYNFHYSYANEQGVMITNLNEGLSTPHQKVGDNYGVSYEDTGTVIIYDKFISWYDRKNMCAVICDYRSAVNISKNFMLSYFDAKTKFITNWNNTHDKKDRFDVIAGVDTERGNLYFCFRPRRGNTNINTSYVNQRRNWQLDYQECLVYNIDSQRWVRTVGFTPESFGRMKGNNSGVQLVSYAAGRPYNHNSGNNSFCNFYGVQTEPVMMGVVNELPSIAKIFQNMAIDNNDIGFYMDYAFTDVINSFTYLSRNQFRDKKQMSFAAFLRNMVSYPPVEPDQLFRSMLFDGKRVYGNYLVFRLVQDLNQLNVYNELNEVEVEFIVDEEPK